jgi:hypothetical protein
MSAVSPKTPAKPQVLLSHHLKQLRLPTFLAEYEKVARDCGRDGIDHPRYLLRPANAAARRFVKTPSVWE